MPPHVIDLPVSNHEDKNLAPESTPPITKRDNKITVENGQLKEKVLLQNRSSNEYTLRTVLSSMNLLAHILIGAVTGISTIFAFRNGLPLSATSSHIVLCVIGYQLLMSEAILSLSANNGWSSHLKLVDKRRAHYILQILGSGLAIIGSFIKILDKSEHWTSLHGKFALVALVFTTVSLVNGLTSLWAFELRKFLPGNISKLTHICFGTVGFFTASIALCYGFEKSMFRRWISDSIAYTVISFTAAFTFIVILAPVATFYIKAKSSVKKR